MALSKEEQQARDEGTISILRAATRPLLLILLTIAAALFVGYDIDVDSPLADLWVKLTLGLDAEYCTERILKKLPINWGKKNNG